MQLAKPEFFQATESSDCSKSFTTTRQLSETLASGLTPEDQTLQSMEDTSPTKWHLAHTSWFFERFLLVINSIIPNIIICLTLITTLLANNTPDQNVVFSQDLVYKKFWTIDSM